MYAREEGAQDQSHRIPICVNIRALLIKTFIFLVMIPEKYLAYENVSKITQTSNYSISDNQIWQTPSLLLFNCPSVQPNGNGYFKMVILKYH